MKLAKYLVYGSECIGEWEDWKERSDQYIRTSEVTEVEFTDLPAKDVVPKQVAQIDDKIQEARAKFQMAISRLEDEKSKLLAITHD